MKAKEFDEKFEKGGNVTTYLTNTKAGKAKPYQVKQVRNIILRCGLSLEE